MNPAEIFYNVLKFGGIGVLFLVGSWAGYEYACVRNQIKKQERDVA